jgi:hypothetical protein
MRLPFSNSTPEPESLSPALPIFDRLWQTKIQSISLIEYWTGKTKDVEIKSGLSVQLEDERRHLRLIGEEIRRLGGRVTSERREGTVGRAFALVRSQGSDLLRLCAYYRGIKLATHNRTSQFVPYIVGPASNLLAQISRDEERHIRWADIRIAHQMKPADLRQCNMLVTRMEQLLDPAWQKLWLDLMRGGASTQRRIS